jgi:membrane-bound serine protease (ClpP class)
VFLFLLKKTPEMNFKLFTGLMGLIAIVLLSGVLHATAPQDSITDKSKTYRVYTFDMKEMIAPPVWHLTKKALQSAKDTAADLIIIHMNTYGGMLESADSIRTAIIQSPVPVWVFIDNNAASAGALISIAADSIYMRPGANIGAATVVDQAGEVVPDKYQSYMRSMMRSTAEAKGRDTRIAEGMVDPRISIPGVSDSGQVITFTSAEAIEFGFCEGLAASVEDVLSVAGIEEYEIITHQLTWTDKVIRFLISPVVSGILIMVIIGGLYFELQTPGVGFPIAASVFAALLYFAPLYIEGIATHWEIILFIAGIILIAIELFVIPGFGVTGIAGVLFVIAGLALGMVDTQGFEYGDVPLSEITMSLFIVIIATFVSLTISFWLSKKLFTTTRFGELALSAVQDRTDGYTSALSAYVQMIGSEGVARTVLRPSGKVLIGDETYDATAESGYIEKGESVKVTRYVNSQLFVRRLS